MKISKLLLLIFVLSLCVPTYAQKKGISKVVKAALGKKSPRTEMTPAIRTGVSRVPLTIVGSALPTQTILTATLNTVAERAAITQAILPHAALRAPTKVLSIPDIKPVGYYYPTWRQELGKSFSKEALNAIENAFVTTDEWFFGPNEKIELAPNEWDYVTPEPTEWDYKARFLKILSDSEVNFTAREIKILTKETRGFYHFFTLRNTMNFIAVMGHRPWMGMPIGGKNPMLPRLQEMANAGDDQAAELIRELELGREIELSANWPKGSLVYEDLSTLLSLNKRQRRLPQEWLDVIEPWVIEHKRWPSSSIQEEKPLFVGAYNVMKNNPNDPASVRLRELKEQFK